MKIPALLCGALAFLALAGPASGAAGDLRSVDFRNFTYYPSCADFEAESEPKVPVKVARGRMEGARGSDLEGVFFEVTEVAYGDLTGDDKDEAVVQTLCNTGGTGYFDEGFVFAMKDGKSVLLGRIPGGDRASGGVRCVRFEDGALKAERIGNEMGAARGVDFVDVETWRVREGRLEMAGKPVRRQLETGRPSRPIRFARGATSATVQGSARGIEEHVLRANEGQRMTMRISSKGKNAAFEVMIGDYTVTCRTTEWTGELPSSGWYRIYVLPLDGAADYELYVSIR